MNKGDTTKLQCESSRLEKKNMHEGNRGNSGFDSVPPARLNEGSPTLGFRGVDDGEYDERRKTYEREQDPLL